MTFSLAARCEDTGEFGCVVSSSSICVTSRCAFVSPYGAVMSQNVTQPALGLKGLELLAKGNNASQVVDQLIEEETNPSWRQLSVVDSLGHVAGHDGDKALGIVARSLCKDAIAAGNMLASDKVPEAMINAFSSSEGSLAERLLQALEKGLELGGEAGPVHSAGILIARAGYQWPIVDLRVDWSDFPVQELRNIWLRYQPEMEDYIIRADNPDQAPSYGVAGDV